MLPLLLMQVKLKKLQGDVTKCSILDLPKSRDCCWQTLITSASFSALYIYVLADIIGPVFIKDTVRSQAYWYLSVYRMAVCGVDTGKLWFLKDGAWLYAASTVLFSKYVTPSTEPALCFGLYCPAFQGHLQVVENYVLLDHVVLCLRMLTLRYMLN